MNAQLSLVIAQANDIGGDAGNGGLIGGLISLAILVVIIAGVWRTFEKAGKPGWGCLIPIYHLILFLEVAGRPLWWFILLIIPVVNIVPWVICSIDIARNFGKSTGFGIGLALLGFIFYPILGFGDAHYRGATT